MTDMLDTSMKLGTSMKPEEPTAFSSQSISGRLKAEFGRPCKVVPMNGDGLAVLGKVAGVHRQGVGDDVILEVATSDGPVFLPFRNIAKLAISDKYAKSGINS